MARIRWEGKKCGCGCGEPADYKVDLTRFYAAGHYEKALHKVIGRSKGEEQAVLLSIAKCAVCRASVAEGDWTGGHCHMLVDSDVGVVDMPVLYAWCLMCPAPVPTDSSCSPGCHGAWQPWMGVIAPALGAE